MLRPTPFLLLSTLLLASPQFVVGQNVPAASTNTSPSQKTLIVAPESNSDSVVAIPPITLVRVRLANEKRQAGSVNLTNWIATQAALNGLESPSLIPWHIIVSYDQFDEDGDNVHSGVYEEYWVGAKKYKRVYKADNLNQTDYATDKGLFRQGDQQWPDRAQSQVQSEVIAPFYYAETLDGAHGENVDRTFGDYKLQCVLVEGKVETSDPTQYCFEPGTSVLRYARGSGWDQTVYNRIETFQGRNIAREVDVTDAGKPYLKLRVETLELIPKVDDALFSPPTGAVGPIGGRVSGVQAQPIKRVFPQVPASLRGQHVLITVKIVIGKNGHVTSAKAISGPPAAYKAFEDAARKWVFKPYLILGQPVEVEQSIQIQFN